MLPTAVTFKERHKLVDLILIVSFEMIQTHSFKCCQKNVLSIYIMSVHKESTEGSQSIIFSEDNVNIEK